MSSLSDKSIDISQITPAGDDAVLPFAVEDLDTRGRAVKLGLALDGIIRRHNYPEPVARLLCEMVTLTVLLGTSLKFDCLLYTSPSPRDQRGSRMPSSA